MRRKCTHTCPKQRIMVGRKADEFCPVCVEEIFEERMARRAARQEALAADVRSQIEEMKHGGMLYSDIARSIGRHRQDITDLLGGHRPGLERLEEMARDLASAARAQWAGA